MNHNEMLDELEYAEADLIDAGDMARKDYAHLFECVAERLQHLDRLEVEARAIRDKNNLGGDATDFTGNLIQCLIDNTSR